MSLTSGETSVSSSTPCAIGSVSIARETSALSAMAHGSPLESAGSMPMMGVLRSMSCRALRGERSAIACPWRGAIVAICDSFLLSVREEAVPMRAPDCLCVTLTGVQPGLPLLGASWGPP